MTAPEGPHYSEDCGCDMCRTARLLRDRGEMTITSGNVRLTAAGRARLRADNARRHAEMQAATR